ncbi:AbiV family abortive infection protein [Vibrio metschnikovii]|uniref:AbiV family abortive infection protein n=1 Tax=Vibrio metschnikovii TaxID=28172 RepID=UPI001C303FDD|nr:AbiV family abortive infection protein [Vibrio metschnikovii]
MFSGGKLNQPKINNLKFDTIFDGAIKCLRNAQELCDEAEILHEHGKYARSFALSHFAREEFGKSVMLFRVLVDVSAGVKVDWKKLNRRFRDHKQKLANDSAISTALFGHEWKRQGLPLEGLFAGIDFKNDRKNSCLYTDWQDGAFTLPSDTITEKQSERNLSMAIYRVATLGPKLVQLQDLKGTNKKELRKKYPDVMPSDLDEFLDTVSVLEQT